MVNQQRHKKWKLAQNLSYQTYVFSFSCVVRKSTAHVDTKALNMHHLSQKGFRSNSVGIPQHQKWYLIFVPSTRKIVSSNVVLFDKTLSSLLAYTSHAYSEALAMKQESRFFRTLCLVMKKLAIISFSQF